MADKWQEAKDSLAKRKLATLLRSEGYSTELEALGVWTCDSVCPAICMNDGCDYTDQMEPDQDRGWCEECQSNTMKSGLVLTGFV